jgi:hypothetical protein
LNLKFLNELAASNDRNFKFTALQRVPLEVNRRVGKGALCAPCPPLASDRVGTARAIKLACHSNDWSARAFAHPTNVIQFHRDLL